MLAKGVMTTNLSLSRCFSFKNSACSGHAMFLAVVFVQSISIDFDESLNHVWSIEIDFSKVNTAANILKIKT